MDSPIPHRVRTIFRAVAIAEACSWALLLAAMYAKRIADAEPFGLAEGGVPIAGAVHGALFVAFVAATALAWRTFGWSWRVAVVSLIASVIPLATYPFERWADRRGLLTPKRRIPAAPEAEVIH